jgi:hypothetical protein
VEHILIYVFAIAELLVTLRKRTICGRGEPAKAGRSRLAEFGRERGIL